MNRFSPLIRIVPSRLAILKIMSLVVLSFFVSGLHYCFSPLSSLVGHPDPACFYMVGKSWAHGLIPYVDVIDIKGPLLFAFFAGGYMIHGTFGVYLLLTLCLFFSLVGIYRIAKLYALSDSCSALLLSVFLLFYMNYTQFGRFVSCGRAEDIMLPFLIWPVYICLRSIVYSADTSKYESAARALGVCSSVIILIKYNATLPLVFCSILMLFFGVKHHFSKRVMVRFLFLGISYSFFVFMVVALFLHFQKALLPCFEVYFDAYKAASMNPTPMYNSLSLEMFSKVSLLFVLGVALHMMQRENNDKKWTAAFWAVFALFSFLASAKGYLYYYIICTPLVVYPSVGAIYCLRGKKYFKSHYVWTLFGMVLLAALYHDLKSVRSHIFNPSPNPSSFDAEICKVKNARILYLEYLDLGLGVGCDAMPACAYWMTLNSDVYGALGIQCECVKQRIPDFVVVPEKSNLNALVEECGYVRSGTEKIGGLYFCLWKKLDGAPKKYGSVTPEC